MVSAPPLSIDLPSSRAYPQRLLSAAARPSSNLRRWTAVAGAAGVWTEWRADGRLDDLVDHTWRTRDRRVVAGQLLARTRRQWGRQVRHVWDRGFATSQWLHQALETDLRFVLRWPKRYTLLDGVGEQRKAWEIARGKRTWDTRQLYDTLTQTRETVGVLALPVTHAEHARPLWLVIARSKRGREPWYLLTSDDALCFLNSGMTHADYSPRQ